MGKINEYLGTTPSGMVQVLSDDRMTQYLREAYIENRSEKRRREEARKRIELYFDRGDEFYDQVVDKAFRNIKNRQTRKRLVELARFQNLTRRIVREISTVYSEAAVRRVDARVMDQRYQDLQRLIHIDRRMRLGQRMTNLCNNAILWFDIADSGLPTIRVVTPDSFWIVHHPNDPLWMVAVIFDRYPRVGEIERNDTPRYLVVTEDEFFSLSAEGRMIPSSRREHSLGRIPCVLTHREQPLTSLLDGDSGGDIVAAHEALALLNIMLIKHQKSGTKIAYASGDVGDMPREQQMDPEHLLQLPEGVILSTLDLEADPDSYIRTARAIIKQIAANYGIPESVFDLSYQATSGFEIELKRLGLREIRRDQIVDWRPIEREFASIQETVLAEARHPLAFNTAGWRIDFGEIESPQDPMAQLVYWEKARQMGLINTVDMMQEINPDLTYEQAIEKLQANALVEAARVELYRQLNISPSTPADGSDREELAAADDDVDEETEAIQ